jgi:probable F420-dependent oxidoreductase
MVTTTLRIGSNVLANDFRHPLVLAAELAAIDALSDGRLICGIGSGFWHVDYEQSGIPLVTPGERIGRLEEAVQVITRAFGSSAASFEGRYYTIREATLAVRPVQQPHPPLLIGGGSPRVLALAAREASIVGINIRTTRDGSLDPESLSPAATAAKVARVRAAAGARMSEIELSMLCGFVRVTTDREGVAAELAAGWNGAGVAVTPAQILASPHALIGPAERLAEDVVRLREAYGVSFVVIPEDQIDAFAPVVARLAGA